jgi:hypothetical protein
MACKRRDMCDKTEKAATLKLQCNKEPEYLNGNRIFYVQITSILCLEGHFIE